MNPGPIAVHTSHNTTKENTMTQLMTGHTIGTREEWLAAREELLVREKLRGRMPGELVDCRLRRRRAPAPARS
jgi:predicted dithiol-disulfide oxidoreductase (DUF899 family)